MIDEHAKRSFLHADKRSLIIQLGLNIPIRDMRLLDFNLLSSGGVRMGRACAPAGGSRLRSAGGACCPPCQLGLLVLPQAPARSFWPLPLLPLTPAVQCVLSLTCNSKRNSRRPAALLPSLFHVFLLQCLPRHHGCAPAASWLQRLASCWCATTRLS